MIFSSLSFMFLFLPLTILGYILIPPKFANFWLLLASLLFYVIGAKKYIVLLVTIILITYLGGIVLSKLDKENKLLRKVFLLLILVSMLLMMGYFKYWDFIVYNMNLIFNRAIQPEQVILPIGISFFTFQAISYVIDVYRGEQAFKSLIDVGLYISFFPQLIAGPIVRFHDIRKYYDVKYRKIDIDKCAGGIWRFSIGLCKKVLLANNLGGLVDIVFGVDNISKFSVLFTWLGAIAYTLQIYYDFSGYSDMAIGLSKIFGFEVAENFNYPYIASSIKEFWRRWHISLSLFFRDYVYIPLGGNRCSKIRWIVNTVFVWLLTGLWHGAAWNYVAWGISYGFLLIFENFVIHKQDTSDKFIFKVGKHVYTIVSIIVLWVVFRAKNGIQAIDYIKNMFGIGAKCYIDNASIYQLRNYAVIMVVSIILSVPIVPWLRNRYGNKMWYKVLSFFLLSIGMISAVTYIYMRSYNPFLYYMF